MWYLFTMGTLLFNEEKAVRSAAYFLRRAGGEMDTLKLLNLLYIAERLAWTILERPIFGGKYVVSASGPKIEQAYFLLHDEPIPGEKHPWHAAVSAPRDYKVALIADIGLGELSNDEEGILEAAWEEFGPLSHWELLNRTLLLPECENALDYGGVLEYKDVLGAVGKNHQRTTEILAVVADLDNILRNVPN